ncbi:hypothetical protein M153_5000035361 [Pseudoloma neurophilia]|uniref:Uncharacterized protein n=1 Tax=Pseudoloma neurophilia TaxID=146866 RepID=A0A0R0M0I2_9MICR|nr:hypothetical protein M153_5000035361 [Pseudoloma neurophilia]
MTLVSFLEYQIKIHKQRIFCEFSWKHDFQELQILENYSFYFRKPDKNTK